MLRNSNGLLRSLGLLLERGLHTQATGIILKKFYIESLGCPKNQVDSEEMIASLAAHKYEYSPDPDQADIIIVNTCGFIEDAKIESIETTLGFKEKYPGKSVIMAGCLSERYGDILPKELREIDGFIGTTGPTDIARVVTGLIKEEKTITEDSALTKPDGGRTRFLSFPGSAYVKISEGCNNRCSYCAIPIIRGSLASRPIQNVVREIETLTSRGIIECILVAQDCGSFGADRGSVELASLLRAISALPGEFWIRLLYIHPDHFPFDMLGIMNKDDRILPYFDIPFQHASGRVLSRMGRKGNASSYLELIHRIRESCEGAVIRSTFLVGFPGETEEDFAALEDFQENAKLDWAGVFRFSREEGTEAYGFGERVGKRIASARKKELEERQSRITEKALDRFVGKRMRVIVEEEVREENLFLSRGYMHAPEIDGLVVVHGKGLEPGRFVNVHLIRRNGIDFEAEVVL